MRAYKEYMWGSISVKANSIFEPRHLQQRQQLQQLLLFSYKLN